MNAKRWRMGSAGVMLLCCLAASDAGAQQIGIAGGYENGLWLVPSSDEYELFHNDTLWDERSHHRESRSVGLEFSLPRLFGERAGLEAAISFGTSGGNNVMIDRQPDYGNPDKPVVMRTGLAVRDDYRTTFLRLDLLARYRLFGPITVDGGVWGDYRTGGTFDHRMESDFARIAIVDLHSSHAMERLGPPLYDQPFTTSRLSGGPVAGVSCDLPVSAHLVLHSSARLRADIDAIGEGVSWHSLGAGGTLGVRYAWSADPASTAE